MKQFEVTSLGERGQVVIPQEFRKNMRLHKGEKFAVIGSGDTLIFKRLQAPKLEDFERMLMKGHAHASKHGLTPNDLDEAVRKARMG